MQSDELTAITAAGLRGAGVAVLNGSVRRAGGITGTERVRPVDLSLILIPYR